MPTLPWLALPPVAIWELIPITLPVASMSGPPELPGLIGASVCSTSSISKLLGAWIVRWTAEMTPVVRVRSRPKGLPIAMAGSPTCTPFDEPRVSGVSLRPVGSTFSSARSVDSSLPSTFASTLCLFWNWTRDLGRAVDDVGVGEDGAGLVDDEARAGGLALLLLGQAEVEGRLRALDDLRADEDDARRVALVDVARGEAGVAVVGVARGAEWGLLHERRRRLGRPQVQALDDPDRRAGPDDGRDDGDRKDAALHGDSGSDPVLNVP